MYIKKIPENIDCGIKITAKILGSKWKACIIDSIRRGLQRPSQIQREIETATLRVINMQLRELEEHGIIYKKSYPGKTLKVEYKLTALGESILTVLEAMNTWGEQNRSHFLPQSQKNTLETVV